MDALLSDSLRIDARTEVDRLILEWHGVSDASDPRSILGPYLDRVIAEAKGARARVELRFERMEYANSSTLSMIIDFTQTALDAGIKLLFVFDGKRRWQRLSLDALRVFDAGDGVLELRQA